MALFEDDRFLRRTQELWDLAVSEITYLNHLPEYVYKRVVDLAELEMGCYAFRSHALHCDPKSPLATCGLRCSSRQTSCYCH